ncbi:unnamed protein product [Rhizophagus irregularis]|uniref:Reverse transcriptase domain-containing protein n=1 Tax=Rhizophagus irregularis TaxID=588596 RepID=A0A915Z493_9GLOM|nr:unnamed protein product [Rhizophagus irregularis]
MGYEIEHCFKSNVQSDQEEKLRINVSSQSYIDDVTWITKSKAQLEQILKIADEFNIMNNIQTNYDKFEMITNFRSSKSMSLINAWILLKDTGAGSYAIKDINTIQAQRQLSRLYNQVISKGMMKDIFEIDCKQLQSELLSNKSPLVTWNISLKDLQVKHCLLARILALLYDNMILKVL